MTNPNNCFTFEEVNELLAYNPETGILTWKVDRQKYKAGDIATRTHNDRSGKKYLTISFKGRTHFSHRLAWLLHTGRWPFDQIDHINGDGLDNRFSNLREVSHAENARNHKMPSTNTSGVVGVSWETKRCKWHAQIWVEGKLKSLGRHSIFEVAVSVRKEAEIKYGYHENHGKKRPL